MLKNLLLVGALMLSTKIASSAMKYSIFGVVAYTIYRSNQSGSLSGGWAMKVDPSLAVDLLFPKMNPGNKVFARMAADTVLGHVLSPKSILQPGRI
jgi:hypothetical protein